MMHSGTLCYMSKPVRLPDYLHAEIERLAAEENRSLANMVKVLLEQALKMEAGGTRILDGAGRVVDVIQSRDVPVRQIRADPHFKPDFK